MDIDYESIKLMQMASRLGGAYVIEVCEGQVKLDTVARYCSVYCCLGAQLSMTILDYVDFVVLRL